MDTALELEAREKVVVVVGFGKGRHGFTIGPCSWAAWALDSFLAHQPACLWAGSHFMPTLHAQSLCGGTEYYSLTCLPLPMLHRG